MKKLLLALLICLSLTSCNNIETINLQTNNNFAKNQFDGYDIDLYIPKTWTLIDNATITDLDTPEFNNFDNVLRFSINPIQTEFLPETSVITISQTEPTAQFDLKKIKNKKDQETLVQTILDYFSTNDLEINDFEYFLKNYNTNTIFLVQYTASYKNKFALPSIKTAQAITEIGDKNYIFTLSSSAKEFDKHFKDFEIMLANIQNLT